MVAGAIGDAVEYRTAEDRCSIGTAASSAAAAFPCTRTMPAQVVHRAIAAQTGRRLLMYPFTLSRLRVAKRGKVWFKLSVGQRYIILTVVL